MKQLLLAGTLATIGTGVLIVADQHRLSKTKVDPHPATASVNLSIAKSSIHAAGRIEGTTENVLIRPHFPGRVESIAVARGTRISRGEALFQLESKRFEAQRDLARAALSAAHARRMRLVDGARESEIEAANQAAIAAEARYEGARTRYDRAMRLFERNALSSQALEDYQTDHAANLALLRAAQKRLETIKADPRSADLLAADAEIASAEAELKMAEIDLERCSIVAPFDAVVLSVDVNPGEWISPEMPEAALELSNTSRMRVVADVDERDALLVQVGQACKVTADAMPGVFYDGIVGEIEPRMEPKKIYGGWAGERNETHSRRVWIDLKTDQTFPIGLPVEVEIRNN